MSRPVTECQTREARRLLDESGVADGLSLEPEDIEMLKAISRGENVARADLALSALRLRLEWSAPKPAQLVRHGVDIQVLNPYSEPPQLEGEVVEAAAKEAG